MAALRPRPLLLALAVAAAPAARAAGEVPPPAPPALTRPAAAAPDDVPLPPPPRLAVPAAPARPATTRARWLGLSLDAGAPEGLTLALAWRPVPALRAFAGPAWNAAALGVHGGLALVPWHWAASPALTVEGGRFFDGDVSRYVNDGVPDGVKPLLKKVGYAWAAAHLGVELGSQRGLAFSLRGGVAWVRAQASGTAVTGDPGGTQVTYRDPRVTAFIPSVKLGLQYFF